MKLNPEKIYTGDHRVEFIGCDVLQAAKDRIRHVADIFDTLVICFSGGKDSLCVLHLMHELFPSERINVVFRDEELIPDSVIDFVAHYRELPWIDMKWFAVPLKSTKYICGRTVDYVQFDGYRDPVRYPPLFAITRDGPPLDQYSMDKWVGSLFPGKVALLNGIRAAESITRYRSCVQKINESYINSVRSSPNTNMVKPIYDWEEHDVFRYLDERDVVYCELYDKQFHAGANLRVSTPLHAESAKRIGELRAIEPEFYNRVLRMFPDMAIQDRYYRDVSIRVNSLAEIKQWIENNFEGGKKLEGLSKFEFLSDKHVELPKKYSLQGIFKYFHSGSFLKRKFIEGR